MINKQKQLVAAGLRGVIALARQVDGILSTGSVENAREAVLRSEMRCELKAALDGIYGDALDARRSA